MATTIGQMYERVNIAKSRLPDQIETIVNQLSDKILELNTEGQLFEGVDNEGNEIGKYSRATQDITQGVTGKGYPKNAGEPFNLYATGKLFKSIDAIFKDNRIEFFTTEPYHPFFQKDPIRALKLIGLTPENQHKLNYEMIKPLLVKWIRASLKL